MSWFKKTPKTKNPQKKNRHHYSPSAERFLEETKKVTSSESKINNNKDSR
jgi:hypothetical protein